MSQQVYSASAAILLNNKFRRKKCCNIGNTIRWKNVNTNEYFCDPHRYTQRYENLAYLVPVKGAKHRYA